MTTCVCPVAIVILMFAGGRKFGGIAASLPLSEEARRLQLLMYTKCFQAPQFTVQGRTGKCGIMHLPTKSYYKWPTDEFRKADHVTVDASRCSRFLENLRVDDVATKKTRLNKFDVKLRPGSTDHDVFLQVRLQYNLLQTALLRMRMLARWQHHACSPELHRHRHNYPACGPRRVLSSRAP